MMRVLSYRFLSLMSTRQLWSLLTMNMPCGVSCADRKRYQSSSSRLSFMKLIKYLFVSWNISQSFFRRTTVIPIQLGCYLLTPQLQSMNKSLDEDLEQEKYFEQVDNQQHKSNIHDTHAFEEQEEDPLDAFMREMNEHPQSYERPQQGENAAQQDPVESYLDHIKKAVLKEHKLKRRGEENQDLTFDEDSDEQECEYIDSDGEVNLEALRQRKKKKVETLEPVDFTQVRLQAFERDFYTEHQDITSITDRDLKSLRKEWAMKVSGKNVPKPVVSFGQLGFGEDLIDLIASNMFETPTPIQCQCLPVCLSGRDIVGVAKTGSGKTLAYVWPLIIHILDQPELQKGDGPIGLVLAPTRELCQQIYLETKKYTKKFDIKVSCLLGGENKHEQWKVLKAGVDVLIASPGRLIEMIKKKATNLLRVTYLVIDEADKMFSMGFEPQLRSIIGQTRDDRQTLLFTATLRKKVRSLVIDYLNSPITVTIGGEDQANEDIQQEVVVLPTAQQKLIWLLKNLHLHTGRGKILIFVNQIKSCDSVCDYLKSRMNLEAGVLHGDKTQFQRTSIINSFRTKAEMNVLIGTDVASRGLDVREIKTVINFEVPKDIDTYIHRIGRTGRAGDYGLAISLLLQTDHKFAIDLVKVFDTSNIPIPECLESIAGSDERFRVRRLSSKMGVSFARGKDATRLLNQSLRKQRRNNLKAGIGFVQPDLVPKREKEPTFEDVFKRQTTSRQLDSSDTPLTFGELNLMVEREKERMRSQNAPRRDGESKFGGKFVGGRNLSEGDTQRITVTYYSKEEPQE